MNSQFVKNHPNIWKFIRFIQAEEKRVQLIQAQWTAGTSKKINSRTNLKNRRFNNLHSRYEDGIINTSELLTGLSLMIETNMKQKK